MKRGSSVFQPPFDAAKRLTHPANTLTKAHTSDGAVSPSVADGHTEHTADTGPQATGPSPFPAATSLFSPDVSTKMASDLLIRLSGTKHIHVHVHPIHTIIVSSLK